MDRYGVLRRQGGCAWAAACAVPCPCGAEGCLERLLPCWMLDAGSHARSHARSHASKLPEVPEFPQLPAARQASPARGSLRVNRGALIRPAALRHHAWNLNQLYTPPDGSHTPRPRSPTASLPSTETTALSCQVPHHGEPRLATGCVAAFCSLSPLVVCVVSCSEFVSRREGGGNLSDHHHLSHPSNVHR